MNLEYESLNQHLREQFPELEEPRYTKLIGGIDAGPYVVFGVLFNQYLIDAAQGGDAKAMTKASAFMEAMAATKDERVSDMLIAEVLPTLMQSQSIVNAYWPLLGASTRRSVNRLPARIIAKVELPPNGTIGSPASLF
jgi:hypothetical protein